MTSHDLTGLTGGAFPYRIRVILWRMLSVVATSLVTGAIAFALVIALMTQAARAAQPAAPLAEEPVPAGLFFKAGRADALLEAPTVESDVKIAINGQVARVRVRQRFHNPSTVWLEGVYVFPLPEKSAVDRLIMTVGERRIEGRILEKAEAERVYRRAAAEGRRAGLLQAERPNVFVTSVANVGPGEAIVIEIEYQEQAAYRDGRFTYRFPMVVAPRYTPGGDVPLVRAPARPAAPPPGGQPIAHRPGAPLAAAPREGDLFGPVRRPEEGLANPVSLTVALDAGLPIATLASLNHAVDIETRGATRRLITLAEGSVSADRDFVLDWRPEVGAEPEAAVFAEEIDGDTFLLVSVLPPQGAPSGEADPRQARELVFVIDTSGSMYGPSIDQAKKALDFALERLTPRDRFNVIRFDNDAIGLFQSAQPATENNLRLARGYVESLRSGGGTEMLAALDLALQGAPPEGTLRQVVFLTDGLVGNEHDLFLRIVRRLGASRLFTIGIGAAPNSYFMRKAAEFGRGSFTYIGDRREVAARTTELLGKLETPALTDIAVAWPSGGPAEAGAAIELYPAALPDLYAGEPVTFTARLEGVGLDALAGDVTLAGRQGDAAWRRRVAMAGAQAAHGVAAIWGRAKFDDIRDGVYRGGDPAAVRSEAVAVALAHRLVTVYSSLVAVDDQQARPKDENLESRDIARNLPHGMDYEKVFGPAEDAMPLRRLPAPMLQKAAVRGQAIGLPQGATPATVMALAGLLLLLFAAVLLIAAGRVRRVGV